MRRPFCRKRLNALPHSQEVLEKWQPLSSSAQKANAVTPQSWSYLGTSQIPVAQLTWLRPRSSEALTPTLPLEPGHEPTAAEGCSNCDPAGKTEVWLSPSLLPCFPSPSLLSLSLFSGNDTSPPGRNLLAVLSEPATADGCSPQPLLHPGCLHLSSQDPSKMLLAKARGKDKN